MIILQVNKVNKIIILDLEDEEKDNQNDSNNLNKIIIPSLNLGSLNNNQNISNNIPQLKNLNLNVAKNFDFQQEFLENYDDFSPSWRKEVDKMQKSKINNKIF